MGIQLDGVVALLERRLEIAPVEMGGGDITRDDRRHGIERLRDEHFVQRLVEPSHRRQA